MTSLLKSKILSWPVCANQGLSAWIDFQWGGLYLSKTSPVGEKMCPLSHAGERDRPSGKSSPGKAGVKVGVEVTTMSSQTKHAVCLTVDAQKDFS